MSCGKLFACALALSVSAAAAPPPAGSSDEGEATDPDELEKAFDNEPTPAKPGTLIDGVPPPHQSVPARPTPLSPQEQQFNADLQQARDQLRSKDPAAAAQSARALEKASTSLRPARQQEAFEFSHQVGMASADVRAAQRAAEQWLLACGPDHIKSCRQKALIALEESAIAPRARAKLHQRVAAIRRNDQCVEDAEVAVQSAQGKLGACLRTALSVIRRDHDRLMWARVLLAQALAANRGDVNPRSKLARLNTALACCNEDRCAETQRRAFHEQVPLYQELDDVSGAAKAALKHMELSATLSARDPRPYGRTTEVDRACEALDARQGAGACRRLEKSVVGPFQFHDFSRRTVSGTGLPADEVKRVNEHFGVLLEPCWTAAAARLAPHEQETYRVSWTVLNDGRVDSPKLERKEQNEGPLGECLRRQFDGWRYPKYRGEWQHVEQEFRVEAR